MHFLMKHRIILSLHKEHLNSHFSPLSFFSSLTRLVFRPLQCTFWSFRKAFPSFSTFQISPPFNPMDLIVSVGSLPARYTSVCLIFDTLMSLFFRSTVSFAWISSERNLIILLAHHS